MYDVRIPGGVWGLNSLAPELRMKVLRQTAAKFTVDRFPMIQYDFYDFDTKVWYKGSAVVKICNEFKLERIHSGTGEQRVLRARFTRGVDSDFKKEDEWTNMGQAQQKAIESYLAREAIIEPFSKLRVAWSGKPDSKPSYIYFFGESDDKLQKSPPGTAHKRGPAAERRRKGGELRCRPAVATTRARAQLTQVQPRRTTGW